MAMAVMRTESNIILLLYRSLPGGVKQRILHRLTKVFAKHSR